ncbi:helix-turn-helix domain-containing protein [Bacteroides fragilis]|nr:helix-turn-helix domain-containing protein [Bacteroides fragilis]
MLEWDILNYLKKWRTNLRATLNKALILLMSRKYTVAEVADMTGFSDPKYFRIVFKKRFGDSPTKYISNL